MDEIKTLIQYRKIFNHPCEKVFEALLQPTYIKQWFGPKEFSIGEVKAIPLAGEKLEIEMITPKGDTLWVRGTFTEITPHSTIAYTFQYEPDMPNLGRSLVTIRLTSNSDNNQTEVHLTQAVYKTINPEGRTKGWEDGFNKMEILLEQL